MAEITANTSLPELASIVSQTLMAGGVEATLSGGAAVSIYTDNRYQSKDLDFVSSAAQQTLAALIRPLGFVETASKRLFAHPQAQWLLEFPPGPLGFGLLVVDSSKLESLYTAWGADQNHFTDVLRHGSPCCLSSLARSAVLGTGCLGRTTP